MVTHVFGGRTAFEVSRCAGEETNLIDADRDLFANGETERLARVLHLGLCELFGALLHCIRNVEECLLALTRGRLAPLLESSGS